MTALRRLGALLLDVARASWQRAQQWRDRRSSVAAGPADNADARRSAAARRFWSELREGQREAAANSAKLRS